MATEKSTYAIFCDMLRHPSAKPLVNRSANFVQQFPSGLSRYEAAEKLHDFLTETEKLMFEEIVVFQAEADEQGMINACEGLEKLITGRLHQKLFEIDPSDAEEDSKLKRHIDGLAWVEAKHLAIPDIEPSLWPLVIEELRRMDNYKAPLDKLTCVVNTCHVINDVLKRTQAELGASRPLSADDFLPLLIFAVLKANPPRLHSNVEFISAFRHHARLNGEHAYWITMLMSAKEFVRSASPATLTVSEQDYTSLYAAALEAADCKDSGTTPAPKADVKSSVSAEGVVKELARESSVRHAPVQQEQPTDSVERTLLEQDEVRVYQISSASSSDGHRSSEWNKVIWSGPCKVIRKGRDLAIKMVDKSKGRLFAECVIPVDEYHNYVEPVTDSIQYFVLKIVNGERSALIGIGFADQGSASDFQSTLNAFRLTGTSRPQQAEVQSIISQNAVGCSSDSDFSSFQSSADKPCGKSASSKPNAGSLAQADTVSKAESDLISLDSLTISSVRSPDHAVQDSNLCEGQGSSILAAHSSEQQKPQDDPFAFLESTIAASCPAPLAAELPQQSEEHPSARSHESSPAAQQHAAVQQACASQCGDPFAEFVDMTISNLPVAA